jgi:isopropylmalate/homocitrate/citramalate synthase
MIVAGVDKDPFTAEPYSPGLVGQRRSIIVGKKSGKTSIEVKLRTLGIDASDDLILPLLTRTKAEATRIGRALSDAEFMGLVNEVRARA